MPDDLYHRDVLSWSEQQAGLLRRLAAGERVNDAVDWGNLIDEVEDLGRSQLRACRGLLRQALVHLLKLHAWPESRAVGHWQDEVRAFLTDARDAYAPSMGDRVDLASLYGDALYRVEAMRDDSGAARLAVQVVPFGVEELMALRPDVGGLVGRLSPPPG